MKVSVCMLAYNHAEYIEEAIESIVVQQTKFDFELVIGDDNSTDSTRAILLKYKEKYPDKIKLILHEKNIGMMKNFIFTLKACKGEYVAICEGDDYWVNKEKLQIQANFLDQNKDYVICFHRVYEQILDVKTVSPDNPWETEKTLTILDLTNGNFMHTNSVMYRNNLFPDFPIWYEQSPIGDYVLHLLNARYGLIKYLPQVMGVYRKLSGTWSSQAKTIQIKRVVQALDYLLNEDFSAEVRTKLYSYKMTLFNEYCLNMLNKNDFSYIEDMKVFLKDESKFVQDWFLNYYPNRIKGIISSRTYKFAAKLGLLKNKIGL